MKPVSIRFRCFGPYMAEQFIDFSRLEQNGIFLICGETGAGKTTILDAMCYALYGRSSGGLRGDLPVMRCKLAGKNDETMVEFVFDCAGQRYKFLRSLKYGRKNLNDSHNCMVLRGEEYVPIFANPKATVVNQKAQELIGLSYDQFRQVIILPQGQFEKLLVSDSAEKEKILVSLFHADRWQRICEELYRRVAERDSNLKLEKQAISLKLKEYGCETVGELEEKRDRAGEELDRLHTQLAEAQRELSEVRRSQEEALLENQGFEELAKRRSRLDALLPQTGGYDREETLLEQADRAERIQPQYRAWQEASGQFDRERQRLATARQNRDRAEKALAQAQEKLDRHQRAKPDYEDKKRSLTVLEEVRGLYESLAEKKAAAGAAEEVLRGKASEKAKAQKEFDARDAGWQRALDRQRQAMAEYQQAQRVYLTGIGSTLAQSLEPGKPCPVCGSLEHPAPAQPIAGHISDAELERRNQAMNAANDSVNEAMKARSQAEKRREQAANDWAEAERTAVLARQEYEAALRGRIQGIETQSRLEQEIAGARRWISNFEAEEESVRNALQEAQSAQAVAQGVAGSAEQALVQAEGALEEQRKVWQEALAASGLENESQFRAASMEPEEKQRRRQALIRFRTDLAHAQREWEAQRAALEGKAAPDLAGLKGKVREKEQAFTSASNRLALLRRQLEDMERSCADLAKRSEKMAAQRIAVDGDLEFANRLRGRSGLSLQRYVLGVMLTSITAAANRLLKNVYGGRYQLYRTDEIAGSGHKGGLELEVYDAANNERRSVTTLSGGEKFLVALSLAIGLSTVVQAQGGGIRLEAMFIDEGFGSLDREAVNDALEVLQGIQRSAGVVGIISHVEQLAETIPTKIEIIKGENGSQSRIHA